jgi:hypothetical protein
VGSAECNTAEGDVAQACRSRQGAGGMDGMMDGIGYRVDRGELCSADVCGYPALHTVKCQRVTAMLARQADH